MRHRDIMTTDTVVISPPSRMESQGPRMALPASLPRPVKLTRNRRHGPSPPAHVRVIGGAIDDEDRGYISRKARNEARQVRLVNRTNYRAAFRY